MTRTVNIPPNVDVDQHTSVLVLPKASITNPLAISAATLQAAEELAFEHTTEGPNATSSQATVTDPRFALREVPEAPGTVSHTLEPTYYYGDPELVLDGLLQEDDEVWYVIRDAVEITEDYAAAQLVDVYAVKVGHPRKNRATGGKATKTTKLFVQRKYTDVALIA